MKIRIGAVWRTIPIGQIEKIIPRPALIPVPRAPEGVLGLLPYDGRAVPVLLPEAQPDGLDGCFAVLLRTADGTLRGVLAEEIDESFDTEENTIDQIYE